MRPRGRMGTLQGSQQLGTLIRAGTWYHRIKQRTSCSTPCQPTHASKNPFFWLTLIFKQMHAGTVVCQTKPTNSFIAQFQENKRIKGNVRAVGPGAGRQHLDFCPRQTGPAPGFPRALCNFLWVRAELLCLAWATGTGFSCSQQMLCRVSGTFSRLALLVAEKCFWTFSQDSQCRCSETMGY